MASKGDIHHKRLIMFLLLQAVGELGGRIVTTRILHLMNEDVELAFELRREKTNIFKL